MLNSIFSWGTLWWIMLILYVPACLGLILIVLLQKGKGGGFAGAFGAGGGTEAVFGPRTSRSLPQKITYTMAGMFMVLALVMSVLAGKVGKGAAPGLVEADSVQAAQPTEQINELFEGDAASAPAPEAGATTPVTVVDGAVSSLEGETPAVETTPAPVIEEAAPVVEEAAPVEEAPAAEVTPAPESAPAAEPAPVAPPVDVPAANETEIPANPAAPTPEAPAAAQ